MYTDVLLSLTSILSFATLDFPITYSVEDKAANSGKRNKRKLPNNLLAKRPNKQKAIYENLKPKSGQDVETGLGKNCFLWSMSLLR